MIDPCLILHHKKYYSTVPVDTGESCRTTGDIGCGIRSFFVVGERVDGNRGGESGDVDV